MKAQFKYAFLDGLHVRGYVFLVIFVINFVGVVFGALGLLPLAALITLVSLSGVGIAVMSIVNLVSDIGVIRRLFSAPGAYLYALTPIHRGKTLLASIAAIAVMDVVSMTVAITGVTWLSLVLAGNFVDIWGFFQNFSFPVFPYTIYIIGSILAVAGGYFLLLMFITACIAVRRSVFYQKRAGGILTALTALGAFYAISISNLLLAPFGVVSRDLWFFTVHIGGPGQLAFGILTFIQAFALFYISARLMERKLNI